MTSSRAASRSPADWTGRVKRLVSGSNGPPHNRPDYISGRVWRLRWATPPPSDKHSGGGFFWRHCRLCVMVLTREYARRGACSSEKTRMLAEPKCWTRKCRHFTRTVGEDERTERNACKAFPDGIPDEIAYGTNLHLLPFPGDHGIQFEPGREE